MFSASTWGALDAFAATFRAAQPFRHVIIDDFLCDEVATALLRQFPGFDTRFALNEMGKVGGKAVRTRVRELGAQYAVLDDFLQTPEFLSTVSRITGIPDLLYDPDYEGGGTHENRHGQGLDAHVDFNYHPRTGWHRRLNLIVYLNREWMSEWGGTLQLHRDPWSDQSEMQEILPLFNRCVVFETNEVSWHGFATIHLPEDRREESRKSFAIYLYTRERPPVETAPPHATVYVPEGMPRDIDVGAVLDNQTYLRLQAGFARLRAQLKYLYERETHFTCQIAKLEQALSEARAAQKIDLQGFAVQHSVSGCWPDGWCGQEFKLVFEPRRSTKALLLDLWVPDRLVGVQSLTVESEGTRCEHELNPGERNRLRLPLRGEVGQQVSLSVTATQAWMPKTEGNSGDERLLAYKLIETVLEH